MFFLNGLVKCPNALPVVHATYLHRISMQYPSRSIIILLYCLAGQVFMHAQSTDQQINTWLKALSAKKDPGEKKLDAVSHEILATDSSTWCNTLDQIKTAAEEESDRCKIRTLILQNALMSQGVNCRGNSSSLENLQQALQAAYEIEDEALQYDIHLDLGQTYNGMHQYGLATMHFHMLFDILKRNNRADFYLPSGAFYDMSYSLYHTQD